MVMGGGGLDALESAREAFMAAAELCSAMTGHLASAVAEVVRRAELSRSMERSASRSPVARRAAAHSLSQADSGAEAFLRS